MKKHFKTAILAICVGTAPFLVFLWLWDLVAVYFADKPSGAVSLGLFIAPLLFPLVVIGTIMSCRRAVAVGMRPLVILLGIVGTGLTGLVIVYWAYVLTHGFME